MLKPIVRLFGGRLLHKLDIGFGIALLRDRRVPIISKLLALGLGAGAAALLVALEVPLESVVAMMLPVLGFALDTVVDGLETVIVPLVIGALLIARIAPEPLVTQIRSERAGIAPALP